MSDDIMSDGRTDFLISFVRRHPRLKQTIRPYLERIGFGTIDWVRDAMYKDCFEFVAALNPARPENLKIFAENQWNSRFEFRSVSEIQYQDFDICSDKLDRKFDLIIADQIFEHFPFPFRANNNVYDMLKPGGYFIIAIPFPVRVHNVPIDCSRWTEIGMSYLLQDRYFQESNIRTRFCGNKSCVNANTVK